MFMGLCVMCAFFLAWNSAISDEFLLGSGTRTEKLGLKTFCLQFFVELVKMGMSENGVYPQWNSNLETG